MSLKHFQKRLKTIANLYNIKMKHLQQTYETPETLETCMYMQHLDLLLQHPDELQYTSDTIKYLEHTLETYVHSHCNMCNIPFYFCNTDTKHLQHTSENT